jgi:hypothetical protein
MNAPKIAFGIRLGLLALTAICLCPASKAQDEVSANTTVGPVGSVVTAASGSATRITFTITQSSGNGTADFRCDIVSPTGQGFQLESGGNEWKGGSGSHTWTFTGSAHGEYRAMCYWYVAVSSTENDLFAIAETTFVQ